MTESDSDLSQRLLNLSRELLIAIDSSDWIRYASLCDEQITAFEPEAVCHLVEGLDFHRFYFEQAHSAIKRQSTLVSPKVRIVGDLALVTYIRLIQNVDSDGETSTFSCEESRVWHRQSEEWKNIHFHRSACRSTR